MIGRGRAAVCSSSAPEKTQGPTGCGRVSFCPATFVRPGIFFLTCPFHAARYSEPRVDRVLMSGAFRFVCRSHHATVLVTDHATRVRGRRYVRLLGTLRMGARSCANVAEPLRPFPRTCRSSRCQPVPICRQSCYADDRFLAAIRRRACAVSDHRVLFNRRRQWRRYPEPAGL